MRLWCAKEGTGFGDSQSERKPPVGWLGVIPTHSLNTSKLFFGVRQEKPSGWGSPIFSDTRTGDSEVEGLRSIHLGSVSGSLTAFPMSCREVLSSQCFHFEQHRLQRTICWQLDWRDQRETQSEGSRSVILQRVSIGRPRGNSTECKGIQTGLKQKWHWSFKQNPSKAPMDTKGST